MMDVVISGFELLGLARATLGCTISVESATWKLLREVSSEPMAVCFAEWLGKILHASSTLGPLSEWRAAGPRCHGDWQGEEDSLGRMVM